MNKIYKLVWSKAKNCYVVASELAKSHTKAPKSKIMNRALAVGVLACVLSCGIVMPVNAKKYYGYNIGSAFYNSDGNIFSNDMAGLMLVSSDFIDTDTHIVLANYPDLTIHEMSINKNGAIASGNTGILSGGTVYSEVRPTADGTFVKKANTTATNITALDTAAKNAIKALSVSGKTITYTKGDGTTGTITTQDTNTTYSAFTGATASAAGTAGLVKAPAAGDQNKFLRGDGTWVVPTNTTYAAMGADELNTGTATTSCTVTAKVVSDYVKSKTDDKITGLSVSGKTITYTKGDGTTGTITTQDTNTTYNAFTGATASTAGTTGLVTAPAKGQQGYVLHGDGTWSADKDTTYSTGTASANGLTKLYTETGTNTDGTMTQKAINTALGGKFNTTGGTLTGGVTISSATPSLTEKNTGLTRGTAPTVANSKWLIQSVDSASKATGGIYKTVSTSNVSEMRLYDYTNADNTSGGHYIGVGHKADGTAFTYAPTPTASSNTTEIATTAFVKTEGRITEDGQFAKKANSVATNITALDTAAKNAIKGLSVSGTTITYTKGDGTTGTITTQDNNTTYSNMTASELTTGTATTARSISAKVVSDYVKSKTDDKITGLSVNGKVITYTKGDGTTGTITTQDTNTTYSAMGADELNTGTATTGHTISAKVVNDYVKSKTDDKLTGLSVSGKTITYTKGDGTTGTITTQDTIYGAGTTALLNTGTDTVNKVWTSKALADYVKGESRITADGTFAKKANTAAANITALDTAAKNAIKGLSVSGKVITYTKGDGTTGTITTQDTNTTYNAFTGATASVAGTTGLVTAPAKGQQGYVLHGDGTWSADKDTTYSAMSADELTTGTATTSRAVTAKVVSDYVKGKTDDKITNLSVSGQTITYTKGDGTTGTITTQDNNTTYSAMSSSELTTGTATTSRTMTAKVVSDFVKSKTDDKIKGLSISGKTITYTKGDGTTGTITTQDTTYSGFTGATSSAAGTAGLVTAPAKGQQGYVLHGDGTWKADADTKYDAMSATEISTGTATTARSVTAKVVNDYVKSKTDDKLTGLTVSGKTITYTKGDGSTGTITTQDTTYSGGTASVLSTGTETTNKLWSSKVLSDFVKGKVDTEANTRSTADTALDNRIGILSSNGYYIKKSATNNMATNMTLLDYQLKSTNDNITGFASDITRNKNNIATLNTSVSSALSSVGAASSVIDLLSNTKADASLANLNASGKRVIANVAVNAVQEYMAQYNSTATPSAPMIYNSNNPNTLNVTDAGNGSLHVGEGSYVNGTSSIAIGVGNQVNANNAGAFGDPSIINADASYVLGNDDTVNTGAVGSFIVGNDSVSSAKGGLTFGSNNNLSETAENSVALGNNVSVTGKNSIALGSSSTATEDNIVSVGNNNLKRRITNVADGNIAEDSTDAITGSQLFETNKKVKANENAIAQKANIDASNINVDNWATKLGIGSVEDGNIGLVNGGTVFNAIQKAQDNQFVQQAGDVLSIGGNTDGSTISVANNAGDGRIITGVITDLENPYSAANVGYVQSVSENIVNAVNQGFTKVDSKINKVGANAAALASLTPASFEGDEKWSLGASFGHYEGETAGAVGAFYKPTENVMLNLRGAFASGENMFGGGVAVSLSKGDVPGVTKRQLAVTVNKQATAINQLQQNMEVMRNSYESRISELESKMQEMAKQINTNK